MSLTRKDLAGSAVALLTVLVYVANVQDWWYLGSNRWAAVTVLVVGMVGCPLAARFDELSVPIVVLGALGVVALVLGIVAIVTAAQWALLGLTVVIVFLWIGATLRHAVTPMRPVALQ